MGGWVGGGMGGRVGEGMDLWLITDRHRYCTYLYYYRQAGTVQNQQDGSRCTDEESASTCF
jgi:hypothetical protein